MSRIDSDYSDYSDDLDYVDYLKDLKSNIINDTAYVDRTIIDEALKKFNYDFNVFYDDCFNQDNDLMLKFIKIFMIPSKESVPGEFIDKLVDNIPDVNNLIEFFDFSLKSSEKNTFITCYFDYFYYVKSELYCYYVKLNLPQPNISESIDRNKIIKLTLILSWLKQHFFNLLFSDEGLEELNKPINQIIKQYFNSCSVEELININNPQALLKIFYNDNIITSKNPRYTNVFYYLSKELATNTKLREVYVNLLENDSKINEKDINALLSLLIISFQKDSSWVTYILNQIDINEQLQKIYHNDTELNEDDLKMCLTLCKDFLNTQPTMKVKLLFKFNNWLLGEWGVVDNKTQLITYSLGLLDIIIFPIKLAAYFYAKKYKNNCLLKGIITGLFSYLLAGLLVLVTGCLALPINLPLLVAIHMFSTKVTITGLVAIIILLANLIVTLIDKCDLLLAYKYVFSINNRFLIKLLLLESLILVGAWFLPVNYIVTSLVGVVLSFAIVSFTDKLEFNKIGAINIIKTLGAGLALVLAFVVTSVLLITYTPSSLVELLNFGLTNSTVWLAVVSVLALLLIVLPEFNYNDTSSKSGYVAINSCVIQPDLNSSNTLTSDVNDLSTNNQPTSKTNNLDISR